MKKIFSLFAAVLFVGSIFAETVEFRKADYTDGSELTASKNGVTVSCVGGIPSSASKDYVTFTEGNTLTITSTGEKITAIDFTSSETDYTGNLTDVEGLSTKEWSIKVDNPGNKTTVRVVSIVVTLAEADPTLPQIKAENIDFGAIKIADDATSLELDTTLEVTAANLTEEITVTAEGLTATEAKLPKEGGILHLHISAVPGAFEGKVKLVSGETNAEIAVVGSVKQATVLPGTPVQIVAGNNATKATINGEDGFKVGSSSSNGSVTIVVPTGAVKLHFFAAAWNGDAGTIKITPPAEVSAEPTSVELAEDSGISGTTPFTLEDLDLSDCRVDVELTGVEADKSIKVESGTTRRFVIWGATCESAPTALDNTNAEVKAEKFFRNGQLIIRKNGVEYNALGTQL